MAERIETAVPGRDTSAACHANPAMQLYSFYPRNSETVGVGLVKLLCWLGQLHAPNRRKHRRAQPSGWLHRASY